MRLILVLAFLFSTNSAFALSCLEPKIEQLAFMNDYIAHVRITKTILQREKTDFGKQDEFEIEIVDLIKGKSEKRTMKLLVGTWYGNPRFEDGKEYVIMSNKFDPMSVGACDLIYSGESLNERKEEIRKLLKDGPPKEEESLQKKE